MTGKDEGHLVPTVVVTCNSAVEFLMGRSVLKRYLDSNVETKIGSINGTTFADAEECFAVSTKASHDLRGT